MLLHLMTLSLGGFNDICRFSLCQIDWQLLLFRKPVLGEIAAMDISRYRLSDRLAFSPGTPFGLLRSLTFLISIR